VNDNSLKSNAERVKVGDHWVVLDWDEYHRRFRQAVWGKANEELQNPRWAKYNALRNRPEFVIPQLTEFTYNCVVTDDKQVIDVQVTNSSGNEDFNEVFRSAIKAVADEQKDVLEFLKHTQRTHVPEHDTLTLRRLPSFDFKKPGDLERYLEAD